MLVLRLHFGVGEVLYKEWVELRPQPLQDF